MAMRTLTEAKFYDTYDLIQNHLNANASYEGNLFETYGAELEFVLKMAKSKRVVSVIEGSNDKNQSVITYLSGFHRVNCLGYLVTKTKITDEFIVNAA